MHLLAISPGRGWDAPSWRAVLAAGVDALLVREPQLEARPLLDLVHRVQDLAPGLELWLAGRLDVALAAGCGLHAPEAYPDLDPALVRLSRPLHAEDQWPGRAACTQLLIAPVLPSPGKGPSWGVPRLHAFLDRLDQEGPRLLALGGVDAGNARTLAHPRLAGAAMIRALWEAPDPVGAVESLRAAWPR